jgi:TRAP-type C4-dicarboxylate transport system substrate-binding protein
MKKFSTTTLGSIFLIALIALFFLAPGIAKGAEKKIKLVSSTWLVSPPGFSSLDQKWFIDEVTKRSKGRISFKEYWAAALVPAKEHLDATKTGTIDLTRICFLYWPSNFPLNALPYMFPFANREPDMGQRVMRKMYREFPQFEQEIAANNLKFLSFQVWDDYALITKTAIRKMEDLKGLKIALLGGMLTAVAKSNGASPIVISLDERYLQLKTGVIDGSLIAVDSMVSTNCHEVAKHLTILGLGAYVPNCLAMNLDAWNKLSTKDQQMMLDIGREIEKRYTKEMLKNRQRYIKIMKDAGVEVYTLPQEERIKMGKQLPDLAAKWAHRMEKKGYSGWEMVKRYKEIYAAEGHRWLSGQKIGERP